MPSLQLSDPIPQELPLPLRRRWLRRDSFGFHVREPVDGHGRENLLESTHNVPFDDLCRDIGNERFLRDLRKRLASAGAGARTVVTSANFVDGE